MYTSGLCLLAIFDAVPRCAAIFLPIFVGHCCGEGCDLKPPTSAECISSASSIFEKRFLELPRCAKVSVDTPCVSWNVGICVSWNVGMMSLLPYENVCCHYHPDLLHAVTVCLRIKPPLLESQSPAFLGRGQGIPLFMPSC